MTAQTTVNPAGVSAVSPLNGWIDVNNGGATNTHARASSGTLVLNGATPVTVANTNLTATSQVLFTLKTVGGTVGAVPAIQTVTPGTGFTVAGTAGDTSTYNYTIIG